MYRDDFRCKKLHVMLLGLGLLAHGGHAGETPEAPWIESVVPAAVQPHASSPAVNWYNDFVV